MLNWKARGSWSVSALGFRLNAIACDGTLPTRAPAICSLKLSSSAGSPLAIEGGPIYALTLAFARQRIDPQPAACRAGEKCMNSVSSAAQWSRSAAAARSSSSDENASALRARDM